MDRRQRKTRNAIHAAFTALLSEKSYSEISVQDIIEGANVGRTTFYAHFETKDYLLRDLCTNLFTHIIGAGGDVSCSLSDDSVFLHLLRHLQKNDGGILDLLSSQNNEIFLRYFKGELKKLILSNQAGISSKNTALPEDYLVNHIASSFVETVYWWTSRGMRESAETINGYFLASISHLL